MLYQAVEEAPAVESVEEGENRLVTMELLNLNLFHFRIHQKSSSGTLPISTKPSLTIVIRS